MENYAANNNFAICPYNSSHRVELGTRFQRHLIHCRKNYPDVEEEICPFNYTHRVKRPELPYHLSICPDGDATRKQIITVKEEKKFEPPVLGPSYSASFDPVVNNDECWDDDRPVQENKIERFGWNNDLQILNADRLSGLKPAAKKRIRKLLNQGKDFKEIFDMNKEEEEEKEIKKEKAPLKPLSLPASVPISANMYHSAGRGTFNPETQTSRIAANIFNTLPSSVVNPLFLNLPPSAKGFGRGVIARPPPGLCKPQNFTVAADDDSENGNEKIVIKKENVERLVDDMYKMKFNETAESLECDAIPALNEKEEREKRMRRIDKKLKQIERLKNSTANRVALNDEEMTKIQSEDKLREEFEKLKGSF